MSDDAVNDRLIKIMPEPPTMLTALKLWWAYLWRSLLAGFIAGSLAGFIAGLVVYLLGASVQGSFYSGVGALAGAIAGLYIFQRMLQKGFKGYNIYIVRKEDE